MFSKTRVLFAAALLAGLANAQSPYVSCETSSNSPLATDCDAAIAELQAKAPTQDCVQKTGNDCTDMVSVGSADTEICGDNGVTITCNTAGNYLRTVLDQCRATVDGAERVGGSYSFDGVNRVQLTRSGSA